MHNIHVYIDLGRAGCFVWNLNITGTFLHHWHWPGVRIILLTEEHSDLFFFKLNLNLLLKSVES